MTAPGSSDIVIIDETEPCPYLPGETARMPLRMPLGKISLTDADKRLAQGHRRTGEFIYQTQCPNCVACQPIRLDCTQFEFTKNQRHIITRGDRKFRQKFGRLTTNDERVHLFNKHRHLRGLSKDNSEIDNDEYTWGFVRSCFDSFEITYWLDNRLACVSVCDQGATSLSAVYSFYDPEIQNESIGTYSILKQIEHCHHEKLRYIYLGYYVAESKHMNYKSRFRPNERLIDGEWVKFS